MKIAVTGATGLIGSRIIELLNNEFTFIPFSSADLDITNQEHVNEKLNSIEYDILLHLAAYTNVDKAEVEKDTAYNLNVNGTKHLFTVTKKRGKKFIYISTDFVFDGKNPPYYEDSEPNPIGYYGQTKYEGEQLIKGNAMIIRPSYPFRKEFEKKQDFVRTIRSLLEQGKELQMVTDSLITPTFIDDIALALKYLFNNFTPEIFHITGTRSLSPYDAGIAIAKAFKLDEKLIKPTTYQEYFKGKAKRPQYSEMKTKRNTFYTMSQFNDVLSSW